MVPLHSLHFAAHCMAHTPGLVLSDGVVPRAVVQVRGAVETKLQFLHHGGRRREGCG
jgi:hypothetical protein